MDNTTLTEEIRDHLAARVRQMTATMEAGDPLGVARFYADNALLTDLKDFRVAGRAAIDEHWTRLPAYTRWRLDVIEVGGDAETPYQRLHSLAEMNLKGKPYVDDGVCFVVWKRQPDGEYRIYLDIYRSVSFQEGQLS